MMIKMWFMNKNFTPRKRQAMTGVEPETLRETEKAVQLCWATEYGKITSWIPKSCIMTEADLAAENTTEKCAERMAAMQAREDSYEALIAQCKAHGIPARKGWRVATMKQRLAEVSA